MSLQTCLADHLQTLPQLEAILLEEKELLLGQFEPQELAQLTLRKYQVLEKIEQLDQQRIALLQDRELDTQLPGLRQAAAQDQISDILDQVLELGEHLRALNENNGILVNTFLADNQQALDALAAFSGRSNVYDASGKSQSSSSTLSFKA
ncbi:flagellar export chaperone FlgN [Alcaligenes sp. SDU_A2]|uniref:flagellar export chaperone FlgN n=1 Tax=Alcaligenes sp. SDU_A2 TaxID=3136634 RepID=UPI002C8D0003|nr:flagellar export chaperone FlgN [Alcaligenes sp.]HRL25923.1 flagellar export chaperone FlgN [Alcaligenes sp.]